MFRSLVHFCATTPEEKQHKLDLPQNETMELEIAHSFRLLIELTRSHDNDKDYDGLLDNAETCFVKNLLQPKTGGSTIQKYMLETQRGSLSSRKVRSVL